MVEALIALVLSILVIAVFGGPAWAMKMAQFGALGFVFWVLILLFEWLLAKARQQHPSK